MNGLRTAGLTLFNKIALSVALFTVAGATVGIGAFATFTGTANVSPAVSSGTLTLDAINANGANNRLSLGASNIAAGDTMQRSVLIKNSGTIDVASISLTTNATTSSTLDTDATNGLQLVIEKCSQAWTESGSSPAYTYTCGGTTSTVLASTPAIVTSASLSNITLTAGANNFLRVTLTLPSAAPNTLQGKSSTIEFAFTTTQRNAASV